MAHEPPYDATTYAPSSGRFLPPKCGPKTGGLVYTPDILYFHFIGVDTLSEWFPFSITNTGTINIGVGNLAIEGEFELRGAVPTMLQPDESVTLEVRFRPTDEGMRLGNVTVQAGEEDPQPKVRLVGLGGTLTGGPVVPSPGQVESIVNYHLSTNAWAYRYAAFAVDQILGNELLMDYDVTTAHTLQPNFAGCAFSAGTPPAADFILTVFRDGEQVGTVTFKADGTVVGATPDSLAVSVPARSIMSVRAPGSTDDLIRRVRMTFVGILPNG